MLLKLKLKLCINSKGHSSMKKQPGAVAASLDFFFDVFCVSLETGFVFYPSN